VHPKLGGTIFGFDVDQNGTEGFLSEGIGYGSCPYASETFDQKSGKIIKVVRRGKSKGCGDDDVTWGVVGTSVGLVEHQHSPTFDHLQMSFPVLNPLDGNQVTGSWLSPFKKTAEIEGVSRNQGTSMNAFQFYDFSTMMEYVVGSDVAKNEFGPVVQITSVPGIIGLNTKTNSAVVMVGTTDFGISYVDQIDVATGKIKSFAGIGSGQVMGIAVDSEDDMAVTTTFGDAGVEFYDLKNQTGFEVILPFIPENCDNACTGVDVEFDPIPSINYSWWRNPFPASSQIPTSAQSTCTTGRERCWRRSTDSTSSLNDSTYSPYIWRFIPPSAADLSTLPILLGWVRFSRSRINHV
jgi:hypothetical protein